MAIEFEYRGMKKPNPDDSASHGELRDEDAPEATLQFRPQHVVPRNLSVAFYALRSTSSIQQFANECIVSTSTDRYLPEAKAAIDDGSMQLALVMMRNFSASAPRVSAPLRLLLAALEVHNGADAKTTLNELSMGMSAESIAAIVQIPTIRALQQVISQDKAA